jgi:hypothetical protein
MRKLKVTLELNDHEIDHMWQALNLLYWATEEGAEPGYAPTLSTMEKVMAVVDGLCIARDNPPVSTTPPYKWEGMVCDTPSCGHSSNSHSGQKGLCCMESCACMKFTPSGRML